MLDVSTHGNRERHDDPPDRTALGCPRVPSEDALLVPLTNGEKEVLRRILPQTVSKWHSYHRRIATEFGSGADGSTVEADRSGIALYEESLQRSDRKTFSIVDAIRTKIADSPGRPIHIVDIGAGTCGFLKAIKDLFRTRVETCGVSILESAHVPVDRLVVASVDALPASLLASADLIFSRATLQYSLLPDRAILGIAKMLRPGGRAFLSDVAPDQIRDDGLHQALRDRLPREFSAAVRSVYARGYAAQNRDYDNRIRGVLTNTFWPTLDDQFTRWFPLIEKNVLKSDDSGTLFLRGFAVCNGIAKVESELGASVWVGNATLGVPDLIEINSGNNAKQFYSTSQTPSFDNRIVDSPILLVAPWKLCLAAEATESMG